MHVLIFQKSQVTPNRISPTFCAISASDLTTPRRERSRIITTDLSTAYLPLETRVVPRDEQEDVAMKLQMIYFPVRARQEPILMAFAYAKMPCDVLSPTEFYGKGWGDGAKQETPYGGLPVLLVDGKPLAQSGSILRYAASLAKLVPADPFEAALCDSVAEVCCWQSSASRLADLCVSWVHVSKRPPVPCLPRRRPVIWCSRCLL
eukprot:6183451-Pleurochrysis_carterae.AAC.2